MKEEFRYRIYFPFPSAPCHRTIPRSETRKNTPMVGGAIAGVISLRRKTFFSLLAAAESSKNMREREIGGRRIRRRRRKKNRQRTSQLPSIAEHGGLWDCVRVFSLCVCAAQSCLRERDSLSIGVCVYTLFACLAGWVWLRTSSQSPPLLRVLSPSKLSIHNGVSSWSRSAPKHDRPWIKDLNRISFKTSFSPRGISRQPVQFRFLDAPACVLVCGLGSSACDLRPELSVVSLYRGGSGIGGEEEEVVTRCCICYFQFIFHREMVCGAGVCSFTIQRALGTFRFGSLAAVIDWLA